MNKIIYETPCEGIYRLETKQYDGTFSFWDIKCFVLGNTEKSFYIQLRQPTHNRKVGDKLYVLKKNVYLKKDVNCNDYWYNNIESRDFPIKD